MLHKLYTTLHLTLALTLLPYASASSSKESSSWYTTIQKEIAINETIIDNMVKHYIDPHAHDAEYEKNLVLAGVFRALYEINTQGGKDLLKNWQHNKELCDHIQFLISVHKNPRLASLNFNIFVFTKHSNPEVLPPLYGIKHAWFNFKNPNKLPQDRNHPYLYDLIKKAEKPLPYLRKQHLPYDLNLIKAHLEWLGNHGVNLYAPITYYNKMRGQYVEQGPFCFIASEHFKKHFLRNSFMINPDCMASKKNKDKWLATHKMSIITFLVRYDNQPAQTSSQQQQTNIFIANSKGYLPFSLPEDIAQLIGAYTGLIGSPAYINHVDSCGHSALDYYKSDDPIYVLLKSHGAIHHKPTIYHQEKSIAHMSSKVYNFGKRCYETSRCMATDPYSLVWLAVNGLVCYTILKSNT